jgi:hypothetical protein
MEDEVECSISVSGWCSRCEQPHVDKHYAGEITLMFVPFSPFPYGCLYWVFGKC